MLRRCLLATIGLLAPISILHAQTPSSPPAATEAPPVEAMEEPQLGDHWTYELRDEITGDLKSTMTHTITDVTAAEISIRIATVGKNDSGFQTFNRSWDMISGLWRFTPNDGLGIRAPLSVGKSWPVKSTAFNGANGVSLKISGTSKVTAKETIVTRAGAFEVYKIETSIEQRNANDATKKFLTEHQTWYAPAIDHWVKREIVNRSEGRVRDRSQLELVEYGRR